MKALIYKTEEEFKAAQETAAAFIQECCNLDDRSAYVAIRKENKNELKITINFEPIITVMLIK